MKKLTYLFLAVGVLFMASCQKPSEKAVGIYTGTYVIGASNSSGTANVVVNGDNDNITLTSSGFTGTATAVTATASGDNVTLAFSSASTTDGDVTLISGTVAAKTMSISFTYRAFGFPVSGTFSGTKP